MPYPGVGKEDTAKVDRCVRDVMAKGKDKDRAVAICVSAIKGDSKLLDIRAATEDDILALQAQLADSPDLLAQASMPTHAIMKFEGACLAKAETNKNYDGITDEGIRQIADTIRLMPLTYEHEKEPRGIFTKGYVSEDGTECLVDGFLWSGHWPEFSEEVRSGQRKLSMDVEAKMAVCSLCGAAFTNVSEYCSHMRDRSNGAIRWLYDLTAVAGGAVKYPAGTGTVFPGKEGFVVISHQLGASVDAVAEWWRKFWKTEGDIPTSKFADKKNRKYPFLRPDGSVDPDGWMAAWRYAHKYGASGVISVLRKRLPKGYKMEGGSVIKSGGSNMKILCSECGAEQEVTTTAEEVQAELDAKLKELESAQSELTQAQADAAQANEQVTSLQAELDAERVTRGRFVELASMRGIEFAQEALESLPEMSDRVFDTFKAMASYEPPAGEPPEEGDPPQPPEQVIASDQEKPVTADTWNVEVGG